MFSKKKMDAIYLAGSIQIEWMQILDEYWDEGYTPTEMFLGEDIESYYLVCKS